MRKISADALARLPPILKDYRDEAGFVFLDIPVADAESSWTELTPEQREHVRALTETDRRRWDHNALIARVKGGGHAS